MKDDKKHTFEEAGREQDVGLLGEFLEMLRHNKKYWMIPLILVLLGFGLLIALGGSVAAPFIYHLF